MRLGGSRARTHTPEWDDDGDDRVIGRVLRPRRSGPRSACVSRTKFLRSREEGGMARWYFTTKSGDRKPTIKLLRFFVRRRIALEKRGRRNYCTSGWGDCAQSGVACRKVLRWKALPAPSGSCNSKKRRGEESEQSGLGSGPALLCTLHFLAPSRRWEKGCVVWRIWNRQRCRQTDRPGRELGRACTLEDKA